jgi:hypothetical protein
MEAPSYLVKYFVIGVAIIAIVLLGLGYFLGKVF